MGRGCRGAASIVPPALRDPQGPSAALRGPIPAPVPAPCPSSATATPPGPAARPRCCGRPSGARWSSRRPSRVKKGKEKEEKEAAASLRGTGHRREGSAGTRGAAAAARSPQRRPPRCFSTARPRPLAAPPANQSPGLPLEGRGNAVPPASFLSGSVVRSGQDAQQSGLVVVRKRTTSPRRPRGSPPCASGGQRAR